MRTKVGTKIIREFSLNQEDLENAFIRYIVDEKEINIEDISNISIIFMGLGGEDDESEWIAEVVLENEADLE